MAPRQNPSKEKKQRKNLKKLEKLIQSYQILKREQHMTCLVIQGFGNDFSFTEASEIFKQFFGDTDILSSIFEGDAFGGFLGRKKDFRANFGFGAFKGFDDFGSFGETCKSVKTVVQTVNEKTVSKTVTTIKHPGGRVETQEEIKNPKQA